MLLTIDIGNSNIVLALYNANKQRVFDYRTDTFKSTDEAAYEIWMQTHVLNHDMKFDRFVISNVVPVIDEIFYNTLIRLSGKKGYTINVTMFPDFKVLLKNPLELGADFLATSFGALVKYPRPIIIVDLGSATKISVLNEQGEFLGGLITPGIRVAQDALNQFIPHLPTIPLNMPKSVIGQDTISAMQAGLMYSTITSIEGICRQIDVELGSTCTKILTGGLSTLITKQLPEFEYEPFLLNEGLVEIDNKLKLLV